MTGYDRGPLISALYRERAAEWREAAACLGVDPDLFFPAGEPGRPGQGHDTARAARAVCATCPVQTECAVFALRTNMAHGVWGGMTVRELRAARRQFRPWLRVAS